MKPTEQYLHQKLTERQVAGNLRQLSFLPPGIDFCSNDYLGLATNPQLHSTTPTPAHGATGSRLISGNSSYTEETEAYIAAFHDAEAALIFNSGYDANIGLLSSIASRHTTFIYDELCHASIIDGIRLAICRNKFRFPHNDTLALQQLLDQHHSSGPVVVVVESVYSMDGDLAPLHTIAELCSQYNAQLVVDEAHATGVYGTHGQGLVHSMGLQQQVFARVHTFGKALGCHGAAVVGSALLRQYLINFARSFIYTTALAPQAIVSISNAYHYLAAPQFTNAPLHQLIAYFGQQITKSGITGCVPNTSPIQVLRTGGNDNTRILASAMRQMGLLVYPILHPTVPLGSERLRICLHSTNTTQDIDLLISTILQHEQKK
jgi:8-amino-7-oxononanoate synthase